MTDVSTGICDADGSDDNGGLCNDTEQYHDANLPSQHKEQLHFKFPLQDPGRKCPASDATLSSLVSDWAHLAMAVTPPVPSL